MRVEVVTPERVLFSGEADALKCRTSEGDIAFLRDHAPFVGTLSHGEIEVIGVVESEDLDVPVLDGRVKFSSESGFVEVSHNAVTILSDSAVVAVHT